MRIDPIRVSETGGVRRVGEGSSAVSRRDNTKISDTTDLLAVTAAVAVSQKREAMLEELKQAYRSGVLQPDPARVAERLMQWGFDNNPEGAS